MGYYLYHICFSLIYDEHDFLVSLHNLALQLDYQLVIPLDDYGFCNATEAHHKRALGNRTLSLDLSHQLGFWLKVWFVY